LHIGPAHRFAIALGFIGASILFIAPVGLLFSVVLVVIGAPVGVLLLLSLPSGAVGGHLFAATLPVLSGGGFALTGQGRFVQPPGTV